MVPLKTSAFSAVQFSQGQWQQESNRAQWYLELQEYLSRNDLELPEGQFIYFSAPTLLPNLLSKKGNLTIFQR